jgi:hypothetical protein
MAIGMESIHPEADRQWYIVGRWQEYEAEARANLLRIIAIAAFYTIELVNYYGLNLGVIEMPKIRDEPFHQAITALAVAWTMAGLGVLLCLRRYVFPAWLKFISTTCDILFLTAILTVADGPKSPMVVGYFLILAVAALRLNLQLIWFSTAGSLAGFLVLLGYAKWFTDRDLRVPRYQQLIVLLAIVLTGVILGQLVRRVRAMAEDYAARVGATPERGDR